MLVLGCRGSDGIPDDAIPMDQMASIISELQLAETAIARLNLQSYDSSKVAFQYMQLQTLEKHGVDSAQYNKSFNAYARYPAQMEEIYTNVLKILEEKSDSVLIKDRMSRPTISDENPPQ